MENNFSQNELKKKIKNKLKINIINSDNFTDKIG